MYKLNDCIRLGLVIGALSGVATELLIMLQHGDVTAMHLLIRSAYGIAHAGVLN